MIYNPTPNNISNEIIWLNSTIQSNRKTLFYNKWFEKDILFIEHIVDYRSNVLYTFEQLQWLYDLSDTAYLNHITLTRCIPNEWKEKLNHEQMTYIHNLPILFHFTQTKTFANLFIKP